MDIGTDLAEPVSADDGLDGLATTETEGALRPRARRGYSLSTGRRDKVHRSAALGRRSTPNERSVSLGRLQHALEHRG